MNIHIYIAIYIYMFIASLNVNQTSNVFGLLT